MEYVPWDTSVLDTFLVSIKQAIGSSVTIGITVFGVIMGILIAISIIRRFARVR